MNNKVQIVILLLSIQVYSAICATDCDFHEVLKKYETVLNDALAISDSSARTDSLKTGVNTLRENIKECSSIKRGPTTNKLEATKIFQIVQNSIKVLLNRDVPNMEVCLEKIVKFFFKKFMEDIRDAIQFATSLAIWNGEVPFQFATHETDNVWLDACGNEVNKLGTSEKPEPIGTTTPKANFWWWLGF